MILKHSLIVYLSLYPLLYKLYDFLSQHLLLVFVYNMQYHIDILPTPLSQYSYPTYTNTVLLNLFGSINNVLFIMI